MSGIKKGYKMNLIIRRGVPFLFILSGIPVFSSLSARPDPIRAKTEKKGSLILKFKAVVNGEGLQAAKEYLNSFGEVF